MLRYRYAKTTDKEIRQVIRDTYQQSSKVIDPHTATGVHGGNHVFKNTPETPTVYLATAEHIKFDQPDGVSRDDKRYKTVVAPLRDNEEDYLVSSADEQSIVNAVKSAIDKVNARI